MSDNDNDNGDSTVVQVFLSLVIIVMALPGLVIEPGPLSELAALGALGVVWGFDLPGTGGGA